MEFIDKSPEGERVSLITAIMDQIINSAVNPGKCEACGSDLPRLSDEVMKSKLFYSTFCDALLNLLFRFHKRAGATRAEVMSAIDKAWDQHEASLS